MDGVQLKSAQETLNSSIRKKSQENDLSFHLKKTEKMGKQNPKEAVRKK